MKSLNLLILGVTVAPVSGATLEINIGNRFIGSAPFNDRSGSPLSSSALVQLGYFTLDTAPASNTDPFTSFTPIDSVSIELGIDPDPAGTFAFTVELDDAALPPETPPTLQFGYRFYNSDSIQTSSFYNTVTAELWQFTFSTAPTAQPSDMSLGPIIKDPNLVELWEGGAIGAYNTVVPIPEPSSSLALLIGSLFLLGKRRR